MEQIKKCTGCKKEQPISRFYKNKLSADGHSIYCVGCTKVNSKKYFQRKKERMSKQENENLIKMALISTNMTEGAESLMKVLMIEKLCTSILMEVDQLKKSLTQNSVEVTQETVAEIME